MPERTGGSGLNERVVAGAGWFNGLCSEMPGPTSTRSILARLTVIRDGIEVAVDASQQVDQDFPLVLSQAGEQPALALKCCDDNFVMDLPSFRRQRDRMAATVARVGSDRAVAGKYYAFASGVFYVSVDRGATFNPTGAAGLPTSANFKAVPGRPGDR